jgi:hypothetical protein
MANFSLVDLLKRKLLGETMMQPSGFEPAQSTQGLLGQDGKFGGGLLQANFNKMNQGEGGLLSNIPQAALLGSAIYGQGIQGKDPLAAFFPAAMQTASFTSAIQPKKTELQKNLEAAGYKTGSPEYKAALGAYLNKGEENTLSKEALALFQQGQAAGKNFDQWYRNLNKADKYLFDNKIKPNMDFLQQVAQFKSDENQDMSIPKGNILPLKDWLVIAQEQNPDVSEKDLIEFYNKKYGK